MFYSVYGQMSEKKNYYFIIICNYSNDCLRKSNLIYLASSKEVTSFLSCATRVEVNL